MIKINQNNDFKIIDLTHTIDSNIPTWDGNCGFNMKVICDYKDCKAPDLFRIQSAEFVKLGTGTHMDAPAHCIEGGNTIDAIPISDLVTDCVVINVSDVVDENYIIMPEVIENFEKENGKIKENSFVIFHTGWDKFWGDKTKYQNEYNFPSVHASTAKLLIERNIAGLGTDTLSADTGKNGFPVHRAILGAGKYLVENIKNADKLPATGSKVFVMPIKVSGGTEAPIRLIAVYEK